MQAHVIRLVKLVSILAILPLMQACTPAGSGDAVTEAYQTSGIIAAQPYTRTIFSSSNF